MKINMTFPALRILLMAIAIANYSHAGSSTTQPVPPIDPKLLAKMTEIDARAARINTLISDFEQKKFTALLRKPLVSNGRVRINGPILRWDTERPEKNVLLVTPKEVRVYYPAQATVEVYSLDARLAQLAASPLPRLAVLKDRFSFAEIPVADMDKGADPAKFLALKLTPVQEDIRQHVQEVRVLLDTSAGYIVQAELTDADGDRTLQRFSQVRVNVDVGDLELKTPSGTKIVHPLEGLQSGTPSSSK